MSEQVTIALIANGTIVLVLVLSRWMSHLENRKTTATVDATHELSRKTYGLTNSAMANQLRLNWRQAERIAEMTGTAQDRELADESKRLYDQHAAMQEALDAVTKKQLAPEI